MDNTDFDYIDIENELDMIEHGIFFKLGGQKVRPVEDEEYDDYECDYNCECCWEEPESCGKRDNMANLYFVANKGCDATTYGLVEIPDEVFPRFKSSIENLNKNSYYSCMPVISVYKISMSDLKEINYNSDVEPWDDGYVPPEDIFYLNDKTYTFVDQYFNYRDNDKCVIKGR